MQATALYPALSSITRISVPYTGIATYRDSFILYEQYDNARPGCQTPEPIRTGSNFQAPRPKGLV